MATNASSSSSPLKDLAAAFSPNRAISSTAFMILMAFQLGAALLLWTFSPWEVLPSPAEVLGSLGPLWFQQGLGQELITSLKMNLQALALTTILSLSISYLTVLPFFRPIATAVTKGRFLGLVGLTFVFTLMVGGGHNLKVALLVFGMSVFFVTSMAAEVASIPQERFDHARTLRMSEWQVVWEVVILGTVDRAFEVFRQNAAIGWMMLTMVEGISRSEGGVGAVLLNQQKHFLMPQIFSIQILILAVGIGQDYLIGVIKQTVCPYADLTLERKSS